MSDSNSKRPRVPKPGKKVKPAAEPQSSSAETEANTGTNTALENAPLIDIPTIKKKKERHVKTDAQIQAKLERKRVRKETEEAKTKATTEAKNQKNAIQSKTAKWKQFLKTSEDDNAEQLKDTSYKIKGDDGSDNESSSSESESESNKKKEKKSKRKSSSDSKEKSSKKHKKNNAVEDAQLAALDTSTPGLSYLVEWKRSRDTWKFQKLKQVWLLSNIYDDKLLPSTHWSIFLEYIHDLKGAARSATLSEAKKIVEAPEPEEPEQDKDQEMKEPESESESTIPLSEEEKAAEEAAKAEKEEAKRAAEVKSARALEVLQVLG
ncbi:hypothetical protein BGW38_004744 [Lunasporangiospora selenospora]|uniref:WKF domain-containing protein n=1 Tax=Lunasporangiospora selenospora TaxID=979761 RepID=A0A9P6G207_9FUNG|nr:hypothetical protein BGW38_004744 [Lunasporangiospora selenospora]